MTASFSCPQCKAVFGRSAHLRRHQKTHRAEKPYVCRFCSVASSRRDVIVRHTRNFHPEASPSDAPQRQRSGELARSTQRARDSTSSTAASEHAVVSHSPAPDGSSQGHQAQQSDLQLSEMNEVALEYALDFDAFNFQGPDLSETALAALPLASPSLSLTSCTTFLQPSPRALLGGVFNSHQRSPPSVHLDPPPGSSLSSPLSEDSNYERARANLALYANQTLSDFRFPSKHATERFVNAFFKHMAPHMPIVHQPTFTIASAASPLLLEVMASGALYLCEPPAAVAMHAAAQQLMFQVERGNEAHGRDPDFQLWMLQTYLLMSYFEAYNGNLDMQQRATHVFSYAIKFAQDALEVLDSHPPLIYRDWVYQETIVRSVASTIEIGAGLASTAKDQCFTAPFLDASFPLPSDMIIWQQNETDWQGTSQQQDSHQALSSILAGQKPALPISELGLVTLVSSILWRVCSFEALAGSHQLLLWNDIVEKIDRAVHTLDTILKEQITNDGTNCSIPSPLLQSTKALLNSVYYHLYGSKTLTKMKQLLDSPGMQKSRGNHQRLPEEDPSSKLNIALVRAAEALHSDCQLGVNYVQRMAPHHFGPISANACYEGGLLLNWYLKTKPALFSASISTITIDQLIDEVLVEVEGLQETNYDQHATLPLKVSAELLSDRSVWQWPCAVSDKLKNLTKAAPELPFQTTLQV